MFFLAVSFALEGNVIMTNGYFCGEFNEFTRNEDGKNSDKITFDDKLVVGGYVLFLLGFLGILCCQ
ncbi:hypothetical protein Ga0466249_000651 [Sporomusaceae bacterium BoRhaA]|nr:hypothetical protein [Pelorhabdus rhamnosifermentans]